MDSGIFAQRQTVMVAAVQKLVEEGKLPATVLQHLNALYTQGLCFEAERFGGLAIWVGRHGTADLRETCFEAFGTVLRNVPQVLRGLAGIEDAGAWQPWAASREDLIARCGIAAEVFARWCRLGCSLALQPPENLAERGAAVRHLVSCLADTQESALPRILAPQPGIEEVLSLELVEAAAEHAAAALLEVGRCLWQVRVQRAWQQFAGTYTELLETRLGLGTTFGQALSAVGQGFAELGIRQKPLARLELLSTLLVLNGVAHKSAGVRTLPHVATLEVRYVQE